jgi:hypothetical protein
MAWPSHGADPHSAQNGVCLPAHENEEFTRAIRHRGSGLHTRAHSSWLGRQLQTAYDSSSDPTTRCARVRNVLDSVRGSLANDGVVPM